MSFDLITGAMVGIYLLVLVFIGSWASKKIHNTEDYIVAGRSLGFWVFTILMVASICSGMTLLGVSGLGYSTGWPSIWEQIFVPLAAAFCIIVFGVKLHYVGRKSGYLTVEDYFAHRFQSPKTIRALSAVSGILVSSIYLVGQYVAISVVLSWLFNLSQIESLLLAGAIITLYTVIGGLYAVSWTTLVQGGLLILGVLIMAPIVILHAGGMTEINSALAGIDPALVEPVGFAFLTPEFLLSFAILLMVGLACAPHVINNVLAAKEDRYFQWSPLIAFLIYLAVMFLVKFAGFAARAMAEAGEIMLPAGVSNPTDYAFVYAVEAASQSPLLWSFFAVIVLAAVMSTTDRLMLTVGSMFAWDIYHNILRPQADDKHVLLVSKISVVVIAAVTLVLALNPTEMLAWLIWMGIGVMLATFAVPLLAGLYWRRATTQGAVASMALGLLSAGAFGYYHQYIAKLPMHFSFYALLVSLAAMVVVSLVTKPNTEKILDETLTGFYIQPKE